jgi:Na+/H+-dicarboxylate symporter
MMKSRPTMWIFIALVLIILGVDTFLDMGRAATNVVGNGIAAVVLAKWEGELRPGLGEDASIEAVVAASS